MKIPITQDEVNLYIRDYRLKNNGEYPAPSPIVEKKRERYLDIMDSIRSSKNFIKQLRQVFPSTSKYLISKIEIETSFLKRADDDYICCKRTYENSIRAHLRKPNVFIEHLKERMSDIKDELIELITLREIIMLKQKFKSIKRDLLENSAKICMNPARIQRLLDENAISLDDIDTLYDL